MIGSYGMYLVNFQKTGPKFVLVRESFLLFVNFTGRDRLAKYTRKKGMEQHPIPIKKPVSIEQPSLISSTPYPFAPAT